MIALANWEGTIPLGAGWDCTFIFGIFLIKDDIPYFTSVIFWRNVYAQGENEEADDTPGNPAMKLRLTVGFHLHIFVVLFLAQFLFPILPASFRALPSTTESSRYRTAFFTQFAAQPSFPSGHRYLS